MGTGPLSEERLTIDHLRRVQKRRELPTRMTQWLQVVIQRRLIARVLDETKPFEPPLPLRLIANFPFLRRIPAWLIGMRPEHVKIPIAATHTNSAG